MPSREYLTYAVIAATALLCILLAIWRQVEGRFAHELAAKVPSSKLTSAEDAKLRKVGFSAKKLEALKQVDVIVIGSGMAGLTCAAALSRCGRKVVILEQHDVAGGCTHSFVDRGYEFDTGLHYVCRDVLRSTDGCSLLLGSLCPPGQGIEWAPMDEHFDIAIQVRDAFSRGASSYLFCSHT